MLLSDHLLCYVKNTRGKNKVNRLEENVKYELVIFNRYLRNLALLSSKKLGTLDYRIK
jgi:hypothetical protein